MSRHHRRLSSAHSERLARLCKRRDDFKCRQCGQRGRLEAHHIVPLWKGGADTIDNLLTLCRNCHIRLHNPMAQSRRDWLDFLRKT